MDKVDQLAQLKDIHWPVPVGWRPLAPGWYVLMCLVALLVVGLSYFFYKKTRHAKPKRQAMALLHQYKQYYEKDHNAQLASVRISELLKRVALVYFPREQVASLHGEAWIGFLNRTAKGVDFLSVQSMLLDLPFKPAESVDLAPLFQVAERWIGQRRAPCSN